ncbi:MAG TPA: winged helix DNA-binding domain-containing protein [Thermoanaerobaculia bacterium]|nr:winged helix DNA-binding domain-containing protein [Thermoanaerobaculia bacterium]
MIGEALTPRALNRALLARQGLLEKLAIPVVEAVESIGALQAQSWPALPVALWSRVRNFKAEDLYGALERRQLVAGTLLRGTLHLVSAREHPHYAKVVEDSGANHPLRTSKQPFAQLATLRSELRAYAESSHRSADEIPAFMEDWIARNPGTIDEKELTVQRTYKWGPFRRTSDFVRVPADGRWGERAPGAFLAAPRPTGPASTPEEALDFVIRCHLRAFGPASADDVADWIGWKTPPVRAALERLSPALALFKDEAGRTLYDLPEAPRPGLEVPAPIRFLPEFDSVQLAYSAKRRQRILPDAHREKVYVRANLRVLPTFLVDGMMAGTWSIEERRREATLTLQPFEKVSRTDRAALSEEAERLVRFSQPAAKAHHVVIAV